MFWILFGNLLSYAIKVTRGSKMVNMVSIVAGLTIASAGGHDMLHSPVCQCSGCLVPLVPQAAAFLVPAVARAANLPSDNGANGKERGSIQALARVERIFRAAKAAETSASAGGALRDIRPLLEETYSLSEKGFKKVFDEYSEGLSYKQQFLDKNAFLVYYSGGFDGVGRDSIEKESPKESLQKAQYGYRNDAWVALDECMGELDYLLGQGGATEDRSDLKKSLHALVGALDGFVRLAPPEQRAALE
jgi:hypothetical protein